MVNALKKNLSPLPAAKYGKWMNHSTWRCHQADKGKSCLEAERVGALGALRSLRSKMKLAAEKRWETHVLSNEGTEKWIEDYVDWETAVVRKRVKDEEISMMQQQDHMETVEKGRSTTTKPEMTCEAKLNAIGDSRSDPASSEDEEDGEDKDDDEEDTGHGKLREDDVPGRVMGTILKTVQHRMESFWQKQMRLDKLTQLGWGDGANDLCERDMKYGIAEFKVPAVGKPQTDSTRATPSPTGFGERVWALDIVPGRIQMPQVTSRQGSSQMRLGSEKLQAHNDIVPLLPAVMPDSSQIAIAKPVQPVSFHPCI